MSDIDDCLKSVERLTRDRGEVMRAGNDYYRIDKIQARHAEAEIALRGTGSLRKVHPHDAPEWAMDAHDDRAALLDEVEKLRAWNARLRAQIAEYYRESDTHPVEREE